VVVVVVVSILVVVVVMVVSPFASERWSVQAANLQLVVADQRQAGNLQMVVADERHIQSGNLQLVL